MAAPESARPRRRAREFRLIYSDHGAEASDRDRRGTSLTELERWAERRGMSVAKLLKDWVAIMAAEERSTERLAPSLPPVPSDRTV